MKKILASLLLVLVAVLSIQLPALSITLSDMQSKVREQIIDLGYELVDTNCGAQACELGSSSETNLVVSLMDKSVMVMMPKHGSLKSIAKGLVDEAKVLGWATGDRDESIAWLANVAQKIEEGQQPMTVINGSLLMAHDKPDLDATIISVTPIDLNP